MSDFTFCIEAEDTTPALQPFSDVRRNYKRIVILTSIPSFPSLVHIPSAIAPYHTSHYTHAKPANVPTYMIFTIKIMTKMHNGGMTRMKTNHHIFERRDAACLLML